MSNSEKPSNSLEIDSSFRNQLQPPRSIPLKLLSQTETTKRDSNKDGGDDQREGEFSFLGYSMCLKRRGDGEKSCSKSLKRFANSPSPDRSVQKPILTVQGLQVVPPLNRINSNPNPSLQSSPHQSAFHEPCSVPNLETRRAAVRAWANQSIAIADSEIFEVMEKEKQRQCRGIELIASENFVCQAVMDALGSHLTNKYSEGMPGARYYGGNHYIYQIEFICGERALLAFHLDSGKWGVNVQPYSCTSANFAVYTGLLLPKDWIMGLDSPSSGHLSHGYYTPSGKKVSAASIFFESLPYKVNPQTGYIDYDKLEEKALDYRPKILICGGSSYAREWDYGRFRKIADKCGAILMCDMAHISGLVAAQVMC